MLMGTWGGQFYGKRIENESPHDRGRHLRRGSAGAFQ